MRLDAGCALWYDFDMSQIIGVLLSRTYNRHCGRLLSVTGQRLEHGGGFVLMEQELNNGV